MVFKIQTYLRKGAISTQVPIDEMQINMPCWRAAKYLEYANYLGQESMIKAKV